MEKRSIIIGDYDTAANGWTLTSWKLSPAVQKTKYVNKPNGDGAWDLSTANSDDVPRYENRSLTATLECSDGTRQEREADIRYMVNLLDGLRWRIELPDDIGCHVVGRVNVARQYNDLAHAAVTVAATCEPWKYNDAETVVALTCTAAKQTADLPNSGRRAIVPTIQVIGSDASVLLEYGSASLAMSEGTYQWPNLLLTPGVHTVTVSGTGSVTISYREAVLE
jgi:hypothetical protein